MLVLSLFACGPTPTACDTMAAYSVTVNVTANDPAIFSAIYAVDGVDKGACESITAGQFLCGIEEAGHFEITVEGEGFEPTVAEVDVTEGECHVEQQTVEVEPVATGCDDASRPNIVVNLGTVDGSAVQNPVVSYRYAGDDIVQACSFTANGDDNTTIWACAVDEIGDFEVEGSGDGRTVAVASVTVPEGADGCGGVPQNVSLTVDAAE